MSSQVPLAGDFLPLAAAPAPPAAVQASPSYWQHAWARLRADRRATASLVVIAILIIGALAGPWLWRVDPALQRLDEASRPPGLGRSALLVADPEPAARARGDTPRSRLPPPRAARPGAPPRCAACRRP